MSACAKLQDLELEGCGHFDAVASVCSQLARLALSDSRMGDWQLAAVVPSLTVLRSLHISAITLRERELLQWLALAQRCARMLDALRVPACCMRQLEAELPEQHLPRDAL